jgi:hypothetical protein
MKSFILKLKVLLHFFKDVEAAAYTKYIQDNNISLPCVVFDGINIIYDTKLCFGLRQISLAGSRWNGYANSVSKTIVVPSKEDLAEFPENTIDFLLGHEIGHIKLGHYKDSGVRNLESEIEADKYAASLNGLEETKAAMEYVLANLMTTEEDVREFTIRLNSL